MKRKPKTNAERRAALVPATEALARQHVNSWIDSGLMTYDMKEQANRAVLNFQDFIIRDIDLYARTGKYPEWAEKEHAEKTGVTNA